MRKLFFGLDPELAHAIALNSLSIAHHTGITRFFPQPLLRTTHVMGLSFPNPIGLAGGFDKNGDYITALATLGFGFIEIGTLTPKPQEGNPRPRLFRLVQEEALINRLGFNNKGIEYVLQRLEKSSYRGILGINIGKNRDTSLEKACDDYVYGFRQLWRFASYITINISSPNTPGLRDLQQEDFLRNLISTLKTEQQKIADHKKKYVPLVVKISPDLTPEALHTLAMILLELKIDGVIATNTTLSRSAIMHSPLAKEAGGLSGHPLSSRSTDVIRQLYAIWQDAIPIIASGGVMSKAAAQEKLNAGAKLIQVYTGLIYRGPGLVRELIK